MATIDRIQNLLKKVADNTATQTDLDELLTWADSPEGLNNAMWVAEQLDISPEILFDSLQKETCEDSLIVDRILEMDKMLNPTLTIKTQLPVVRKMYPWRKIGIAAAVICLIGCLLFIEKGRLLSNKTKQHEIVVRDKSGEILPGGNKAVLTLHNGKQIVLDSGNNGLIANEGKATVQKQADGQLNYTATNKNQIPNEVVYNTLSTPRGGAYKILLPDGTKAWLNAASEITFPTAFVGNNREVSIKGEVYFEVMHNASKPFIVKTDNNMQIQVLGTHFDVNAYPDEKVIKTTLLEGSVKVTSASDVKMLKPGEQMQLLGSGKLKVVYGADIESIMGWKEGVFNFDEADISSVMRQLSRWYNIDVVYTGAMPQDFFTAIISRNNNINQVLTMLENTLRVHFNIQNRTIYVTN